jgi:hypothetical protein
VASPDLHPALRRAGAFHVANSSSVSIVRTEATRISCRHLAQPSCSFSAVMPGSAALRGGDRASHVLIGVAANKG